MATVYYRNRKDRIRQDMGDDVARTYGCWTEIRRRIRRPGGHDICYKDVSIDPRWDRFDMFLADMGAQPKGLSIDRIDNAKGYEPGNCRWASATTQSRNRGAFVKLDMEKASEIRRRYSLGGVSKKALADEYGVTPPLIGYIVRGENWKEGNF